MDASNTGRRARASSQAGDAEGAGFEPAVRVNGLRFSRPVHSTALPPLRTRRLLLYAPAGRPFRAGVSGVWGPLVNGRAILRGSAAERGSAAGVRAIDAPCWSAPAAVASAAASRARAAHRARTGGRRRRLGG